MAAGEQGCRQNGAGPWVRQGAAASRHRQNACLQRLVAWRACPATGRAVMAAEGLRRARGGEESVRDGGAVGGVVVL